MAVIRVKKGVQLELNMPTWGGAREGAGRKRIAERSSVPHVARPNVRAWNPVLITMRVRAGVPNLRGRKAWAAVVRTVRAFRGRFALRFVHYTVLFNHLHLIAESDGRESLSRGMQAFTTQLAKALNACFVRSGSIFASRYHARELNTPREVSLALQYVLLNRRKHAAENRVTLPASWIDHRSTAMTFDGWRDPVASAGAADLGASAPQSWLLRVGWRRHGLLDHRAIPGGMSSAGRSTSRAPAVAMIGAA